jgi:hypothetical protein
MVGRGRAAFAEGGAAVADRVEEAVERPISVPVISASRASPRPAGTGGVDQVVGAEGGDDPPGPAGGGDLSSCGQVRQGGVRRRQKLDPEPVEQRAGPVRGIGQPLGDLIMYKI